MGLKNRLFGLLNGNKISASSYLSKNVKIGINNNIFRSSIIGELPQMHGSDDKQLDTKNRFIIIGNNNVIREFTTVHQPYISETKIGDNNILMAYSHVGHDVIIGDNNKITNSVNIAGFVKLSNNCYLGMGSTIQQRTIIGPYTVLGMLTSVTKNIPPFSVVIGNPGQIVDINARGMRKMNCSNTEIRQIKEHLLSDMRHEVPKTENNFILTQWRIYRHLFN